MNIQQLVQLKLLERQAAESHVYSEDLFAANPELAGLKQICVRLPLGMLDRLDTITAALDVPKRLFVERAVADALDLAEDVLLKNAPMFGLSVGDPEGK